MDTPNTTKVGQLERKTQNRIVSLFRDRLGYDYLGNWEERDDNSNVEEGYLRLFLARAGHSEALIQKAISELKKTANHSQMSLYDLNKETYSLLRYGIKVREELGENYQTVWPIDWENPENNHFAVAEEVTIRGNRTKRPDVVLYVNGIALGVLELKRSIVSVSEGIRQNIGNQKEEFIKTFFGTVQLVMAGNDTEGLLYGTTETTEEHYLTWKEAGLGNESRLDRSILQLCEKKRLLEMVHDFIVFDSGIKKTARHNQYFGVKAAREYAQRHEGGIIWHTQGSGKSLTMVWLAKWIRENITDARVLLLTDRTELDEQIEKVFFGVDEKIHRTKSSKELLAELNTKDKWLLCSLVHKFGRAGGTGNLDVDDYVAEIKKNLPKDFSAKGNLFVFVDECHRTQSGKLHEAMKELLPTATFIGFTGTPLLKVDKSNSIGTFGPYIHTYKYNEAVADKVVLDLRYEARRVDQSITSQEKIDEWFEERTQGLTDVAKAELKRRWGTMQSLLSSRSRLEKVVFDILDDFYKKDRLASGRGNAMLVASSIYEACQYYEIFQTQGFTKCAVVTSYEPGALSTDTREYAVYQKMLNGKSTEDFEKEIKKKFIETPGQMQLLIVVDKLLTGFDAPPATYLYIDKNMQDHGLFQAICRVNRLDGEDKEYGYIVDYRDLFKKLEQAVGDYTAGALEGFDKEDVLGLLKDRMEEGKKDLDEALEIVRALCEPVSPPKDSATYIRYFCGDVENPYSLKENEVKRVKLYKTVSHLLRAYADLANDMASAGYTKDQAQAIEREVRHFERVRMEVKLASGDYIDLKKYEPAMRVLIDRYITAKESEKLSAFDDMTLVDLIVQKGEDALNELPDAIKQSQDAMAETIENNVRKLIIDEMPTNPKYYLRMSELLDELVKKRKQADVEYKEYLKQVVALSKKVKNPMDESVGLEINTSAKRALYDNLGQDVEKALVVDKAVLGARQSDWRGNHLKERAIKIEIKKALPDISDEELKNLFEIIKNQNEY
ncbi:MAG: Type I site-specific deoxyribonuclease, HsdR family [Microgenomates group bacterium GW2011_GWC1_41_8]|uniref:Type I restriction enzyme endonuclease subunit n=1 Tax=Candidatus Roizmanbacteria bacterium GW2011_GWA1_41_13 TaxID=1618474 RepID=A0A0G0Y0A8_9BACT|nr:MAG: Type I site-specific deoxyribonuclease, HsdR family [Candidatus Roizmanbacteria bacterium GW2011_GWA1_41_13]KKS23615.1 MAG: Type I site-specific deoxyribonuclease, HsdR family [Microgenomates group bacterium GW2011_GWC1_41_8]